MFTLRFYRNMEICVCNPILVTFPEWLSCTEPWPNTPGAVHLSSSCLKCVCEHINSYAGLIWWTPLPMFSDTAITDRHSETTTFPAQSTLGADILVYWMGKIILTCAAGGNRTLDILHERRTPYPLGQGLCSLRLDTCN